MDSSAFYISAEFWVAVAFIVVVSIVFKPVIRSVSAILDSRTENIKSQLSKARLLREEAQELLAEHQRNQLDAIKIAESLVTTAKIEAERYKEEILGSLENDAKLKEAQALQHIINAESQAIADVRDFLTNVSISAAKELLAEYLSSEQASMLINSAIRELPHQLQRDNPL